MPRGGHLHAGEHVKLQLCVRDIYLLNAVFILMRAYSRRAFVSAVYVRDASFCEKLLSFPRVGAQCDDGNRL